MFSTFLKRAAARAGFTIIRQEHVARAFVDHPPHSAFDLLLVHCFGDLRGLNFIQVGANDGAQADPIAEYLQPCGWSGFMFEPLAANHAALQRRHGDNPCLQIRRLALDATTGRRLMYNLDPVAIDRLPGWARGLGSFSRERLLTACRELNLGPEMITAEEVATITWDEIWRDFGPRRCDVLVLDTEGHDIRLLRLADLAGHRPRLIRFEHACCRPEERLTFYGELLELGYELSTQGPDTVAHLGRDPAPTV